MKKLLLAAALVLSTSPTFAQTAPAASGLYYPARYVTLSSLGINCDGVTDVGAAIQAAINSHPGIMLDGEGKTCASSIPITITSATYWRNTIIIDINPGRSSAREVTTPGGATVVGAYLSNIKVLGNGSQTVGDVNNNGNFWLANIQDSVFENLDATGDGIGKGFYLSAGTGVCENNVIRGLNVHDKKWAAATDPNAEQIDAVRISCNHWKLSGFRIANILGNVTVGPGYGQLTGSIPNNIWIPYQAHCLVVSQSAYFEVSQGNISNCATGLDFSGSLKNTYGTISDIVEDNIGDYAIKLVHDPEDIYVHNVVVFGSGNSTVFFQAGLAGDAGTPTNDVIQGVTAINPGQSYNWGTGSGKLWANPQAAFTAQDPGGGTTPMVGIRWLDNIAVDTNGTSNMSYGFERSATSLDVQLVNNKVTNPFTSSYHNFTYDNDLLGSVNIPSSLQVNGTVFTAAGLALAGGASASAQRTTLGLGTSATVNTGTSGATIPLLNGSNTHTGTDTFQGTATSRAGVTLVNGLNSNIANGNNTLLLISGPTAAFSVGGFTTVSDGKQAELMYGGTQPMTVKNQDTSTNVGDRILTGTGADLTCRSGPSDVGLVYDGASNIWRVRFSNGCGTN